MEYYNNQYYNFNQLKEVATPTSPTDAANKAYVDQAVANSGGGSGGAGGSFSVTDDDNGNIAMIFTAAVMTLIDDNNGGITLIFT